MYKNCKVVIALTVVTFIFVVGLFRFSLSVEYTKSWLTGENNMSTLFKEITSNYNNLFPENAHTNLVFNKWTYLSVNSTIASIMGQRHINGVIKTYDGKLLRDNGRGGLNPNWGKKELRDSIKMYEKLSQIDVGVNIPYLMVLCSDINSTDNRIPIGYTDKISNLQDHFLYLLDEHGIDYIDMRVVLRTGECDFSDYIFKTDHHWNTYGAFLGYMNLIERLSSILWLDSKLVQTDIQNYKIERYPEAFIGIEGRRVGYGFVPADDIDLIVPAFETDIEIIEKEQRGTFNDIFLNKDFLTNGTRKVDFDAMSVYSSKWRNSPYTHFVNHSEIAVDKKIMIIGDSWSTFIVPLVANTFSETCFIFSNNTKDVTKVAIDAAVTEFKPDIIVDVRYHNNLNRKIYY